MQPRIRSSDRSQHGCSNTSLTREHLRQFLEDNSVSAGIHVLPSATSRVEDSAEALGISTEMLVKSIVLWVSEEYPVIVLAAGTRRINLSAVARLLLVTRKQVRLATPEEALSATGYKVGTIPPLGHRTSLRTLVDVSVMASDEPRDSTLPGESDSAT
ncbi:hypothetical protein CYMTET_5722, partial [Cymbomonas tetramitiformis]